MKGEFDALRKVARLASDCVEIKRLEPPDGAAAAVVSQVTLTVTFDVLEAPIPSSPAPTIWTRRLVVLCWF